MKILQLYRKSLIEKELISSVRKNSEKIKSDRQLTKAQEKDIKQYYRDLLGIDVPLDWHRYFYKRNGIYSEKYIPTSLYYTSLIGRFNHFPFNEAYTDKNLIDVLIKDIKQPEVVLKNIRGYYYINGQTVDYAEALDYCSNLYDVIIKPTFASHGEGVKKFEVVQGKTNVDGLTIDQFLSNYDKNYIIQKVVKQHPEMNVLNSSSVNTVRIITYRSGMDVLVPYSVVRIGRLGYSVDNEMAGGISTKINTDGTLNKYAYGAPGNDMVEKTDSGVILDGYKIPSFAEAVEKVCKLHKGLPYFDLIGWDIAIDETGEPLLIEWNTWPELSQSASGPAFGTYTNRILKEIWDRRNTRDSNW